jgi:hypothetical protein
MPEIAGMSTCGGLVQKPKNAAGGTNPRGGILAGPGIGLVSEGGNDFAFILAGNEEKGVAPAV